MKKIEWRLWARRSNTRERWNKSNAYDSYEALEEAFREWVKANCNYYDFEIRCREVEILEFKEEGE